MLQCSVEFAVCPNKAERVKDVCVCAYMKGARQMTEREGEREREREREIKLTMVFSALVSE